MANCDVKVNIYASTVAKAVFVWICLVCLVIGYIWTLIGRKFAGQQEGLVGKLSSMALSFTPQGKAAEVGAWFGKNGGIILTSVSLFVLIIIEAFWRPHKYLKKVDNAKLKDFIRTTCENSN